MSKELIKTKQNLLKEQGHLRKENNRLKTVIDSQAQIQKNEERLKEIQEELLIVHVKMERNESEEEIILNIACILIKSRKRNSNEYPKNVDNSITIF